MNIEERFDAVVKRITITTVTRKRHNFYIFHGAPLELHDQIGYLRFGDKPTMKQYLLEIYTESRIPRS